MHRAAAGCGLGQPRRQSSARLSERVLPCSSEPRIFFSKTISEHADGEHRGICNDIKYLTMRREKIAPMPPSGRMPYAVSAMHRPVRLSAMHRPVPVSAMHRPVRLSAIHRHVSVSCSSIGAGLRDVKERWNTQPSVPCTRARQSASSSWIAATRCLARVYRHVCRHVQMRIDTCRDMDMCMDICIAMCAGMCAYRHVCRHCRHVCRPVCRHVHTHMWRYAWEISVRRHVYRHGCMHVCRHVHDVHFCS